MSNVAKRTPGELINRVSGDAATLQDFMTRQGKDMIFQTTALVALLIITFITNWKLAIVITVPLPLAAFLSIKSFNAISVRYGRELRQRGQRDRSVQKCLCEMGRFCEESRYTLVYGTAAYPLYSQHRRVLCAVLRRQYDTRQRDAAR